MEEEGMVTQSVRKLEMGVVVFIFLQIHCNSQTAASHKCITSEMWVSFRLNKDPMLDSGTQ
jgi:hypothetical protein